METWIEGLHAERRGSGAPMLLLHGIGHRWQMWLPLVDSLARDFDVVAVDLPGFGDSPRSALEGPLRFDRMCDALESVLDRLGWDRAHVVGNSLGGWLALELARRGRALSVTGLAPAGLWTDRQAVDRRLRRWFGLWIGGARRAGGASPLLRYRPVRAVALRGLFGRPWRVPPQIAIDDAANLASSAFDEVFNAPSPERFVDGQAIAVPVTIAWGARDPLFDRGNCAVDQLPPATRVETLRGCGHVPTWDDPPLVLELIRSTAAGAPAPDDHTVRPGDEVSAPGSAG